MREQRARPSARRPAAGRLDATRSPSCSARVEDVYVDELLEALDRRARARDARRSTSVEVGASVRGSLALERDRARLGARCTGATTSCRRTSSSSSCPCSATGWCSAPAFLAETRQLTRDEALARVRDALPRARARRRARTGRRRGAPARRAVAVPRASSRRAFPLVPRRRLAALPFGDAPSARRGRGTDVAGSRAYVRATRSRRSTGARQRAPLGRARRRRVRRPRALRRGGAARRRRLDRRPSMALYPRAVAVARRSRRRCAPRRARSSRARVAARGAVGYLDYAGAGARRRAVLARRRARPRAWAVDRARGRGAPASTRRTTRSRAALELLAPRPRRARRPAASSSSSPTSSAAAAARSWLTRRALAGTSCRSSSRTRSGSRASRASAVSSSRSPTRATGSALEVRLTRREARERRGRERGAPAPRCSTAFAAARPRPGAARHERPGEVDRAFLEWAEAPPRAARGGAGERHALLSRVGAVRLAALGWRPRPRPLACRRRRRSALVGRASATSCPATRRRSSTGTRRVEPQRSRVAPGFAPLRSALGAARRHAVGRHGQICATTCQCLTDALRAAAPVARRARAARHRDGPRPATRAAGRAWPRLRSCRACRRAVATAASVQRRRPPPPATVPRRVAGALVGRSGRRRRCCSLARRARARRPSSSRRRRRAIGARRPRDAARARARAHARVAGRARRPTGARRSAARARSRRGAGAELARRRRRSPGRGAQPDAGRVDALADERRAERARHEPRRASRSPTRAAAGRCAAHDASSASLLGGRARWRSRWPRSLVARHPHEPRACASCPRARTASSCSTSRRASRPTRTRGSARRSTSSPHARPLRPRRLLRRRLRGAAARDARVGAACRSPATSRCRSRATPGIAPTLPGQPVDGRVQRRHAHLARARARALDADPRQARAEPAVCSSATSTTIPATCRTCSRSSRPTGTRGSV